LLVIKYVIAGLKTFQSWGDPSNTVPLYSFPSPRLPVVSRLPRAYTDKKERHFFPINKEIQSGAVAKSYMRKDFPTYEEMGKYFPIYKEAVSYI
jgi:hypothetical protein